MTMLKKSSWLSFGIQSKAFVLVCMLIISFPKQSNSTELEAPLTIKQIMSDPDWIGAAPQQPYWSENDDVVYFSEKIPGRRQTQLMTINLATGEKSAVSDQDLHLSHYPNPVFNHDRSLMAYIYQNDVFVKYDKTDRVIAVTSSHSEEKDVQFLTDGRISFRVDQGFFAVDLMRGGLNQLAQVVMEDEPDGAESPKDFLGLQQRRLFDYLRTQQDEKKNDQERQKTLQDLNPFSYGKPFYLGKNYNLEKFSLSPNGHFAFVALSRKEEKEKQDNMPRFITDDGYVHNVSVRALVGQEALSNEEFWLLDLEKQTKHSLSVDDLPGIKVDPLADLKKKVAKSKGENYKKDTHKRAIYIFDWAGPGIVWSKDGNRLALKIYSHDNKDRWLAEVDLKKKSLNLLHRQHEHTWVNDWTFSEMGWLNDNQTFYYLSEEKGYSHIYLKPNNKKAEPLTYGNYEVSDLTLTRNDRYFYFRANKKHPGIYEIYRVVLKTGEVQSVTDLGGLNTYVLSHDEKQLLISHSTVNRPEELYWQSVDSHQPKQLTHNVSEAFRAISWVKPQIVGVPSSHVDAPIYSRLYLPEDFDPEKENQYPAVMFVHGAGYLQNAHQGWSGYFREFMFHTFLTRQGYVVLDMDYRASKGYGKAWRTAIYRQMGTPELEDLIDGKQFLVKNYRVNPDKVGIYGGSYGGFMTFMALFKAPAEFASGASLRPVTDWSSYNHGYTSNILNTPEIDPEAYNRSSPIEYAQGLSKPLLIAHGMVDDNVFFKDSVRLVQKLIELEKTPLFEMAVYPVEPHGFREPSSWLDEYTRIYRLFEKTLK